MWNAAVHCTGASAAEEVFITDDKCRKINNSFALICQAAYAAVSWLQ